jgi:hypothetical protein
MKMTPHFSWRTILLKLHAVLMYLFLTFSVVVGPCNAAVFTLEPLPKTPQPVSIWGVAEGADVVAAVGWGGAIFIKEGVSAWEYKPFDKNVSLFAVTVDDQGVITAVGSKRKNTAEQEKMSDGIILRSIDRGHSFQEAHIAPDSPLLEVVWSSAGQPLIATGMKGTVLRSFDTGKSWIQTRVKESVKLWAAHFHDQNAGLVAGGETPWMDKEKSSGIILQTLDGAKSFNVAWTGKSRISDFSFVNKNVGYATGVNGIFLTTADGGATWKEGVQTPQTDIANAIKFISEKCALVVGGSNRAQVTNDGAKTWPIEISLTTADTFAESISAGRNGRLWVSLGSGEIGFVTLTREDCTPK